MKRLIGAALLALCLAAPAAAAEKWKPLFNGRDLAGWTPKFTGHALGENWRDTFSAKDGVISVSYAKYDTFSGDFGHLFYRTPFSSYRLRLEYRFTGDPAPGAPNWANRNSGVMLHSQDPRTIVLNQSFPISIEAQLLGSPPGQTRTTANVCTVGATVSINGVPATEHCVLSAVPAREDGEWVRLEVEVRGSKVVRHLIDGVAAVEYTDLRRNPAVFPKWTNVGNDDPLVRGLAAEGPAPLKRGYIALQAEGSPIQFRNIEILRLRER